MKIAFSTISCPGYDAEQIARAVGDYGYDGVELYALEGERLTPDLLRDRFPELRKALAGTEIASINSWAALTSSLTPGGADPEAQVIAAMELAADLGCPMIKSFGGAFPDDHPAEAVIDHVAAAANRLADHGRRTGVRLVIETHDGFCLGRTLAAVLDQVPDDGWVNALWDVHHPYRMGEAVADTDALVGDRVRHVHVKDAVRAGDGWSFVRLGEGELPVESMIKLLAARGYDGYVSVDWEKMWHPEIEDPETVLPQYAEVLRTYLG
ncbi:sugar phosphate isomerase/epimerase family protein [Microlunatus speluncae]|uniref:sugar phosphate isomerase/epimerase family protein n=1 Tax=Microlunatus speluncae TaxID=2594267 RepID=UPI001375AAB3|nr:sugar phosphate isomerase/epimerase family protein [Microlunatus speluncae]